MSKIPGHPAMVDAVFIDGKIQYETYCLGGDCTWAGDFETEEAATIAAQQHEQEAGKE